MMKNLFQRLTFTLLFGLMISLTFSSCKDEAKEAYTVEISKADALFQEQKYADAKAIYLKASNLKKDAAYPKEQISKIDALLVKEKEVEQSKAEVAEAEVAPKIVEAPKSQPFHIIVGSFSVQKNAIGFQKEWSSNGEKSTIVKSREGNYLISVQSFETITKAYNYLEKSSLNDAAWVYRVK
ncbi:SPOR domain-containing protein [Flavicella sediminum]|uniref:SPOR domain-containing protein n=1 Tax=Flavicella sediminum TaxID=2585141 RepID=UPI001122087A|nr:hypothetical protein [Flavicella sediminum]